MAVYSAQAVILRKLDYSEADRILTLFTLERGKLAAIAKGVRKSKARMAGQLDVFGHGRMMLAEGRNLDVITQFQRITDVRPLSEDLPRSAAAAVVVELADKVLEERHPQPELFQIVVDGLSRLAAAPAAAVRMESVDFLSRILLELGYAPAATVCARCGGPLHGAWVPANPDSRGGSGLGFSAASGGVVCAACAAAVNARAISTRAVKVLRVAAAGDRDLFLRLRLEPADVAEVEDVLAAQLEHHLDRQLKSIDFARKVWR
ncbi:MAG TPA: DNA repair protein RecO [Candidatus Dormibacteraeota bacterium]|jgi:DNA repair protein RecO (recombination protein O)|nr:DNA repair protein RecO [Candidatus Dormibacteraeota bacterium]